MSFHKHNKTEQLFVTSMDDAGLNLNYLVRSGFTKTENNYNGPHPESFLYKARDLEMHGTFHMADFKFKLLETAVIDGLTACGKTYFEGKDVTICGTPLVSYYQIH
jgi:hypothetical protein